MRTAVFSIISPNYRHFARVLMASAARHHPEWDRFVLLVGDGSSRDDEAFTTITLDALPLPHRRQFCFRYSLLELNTAVKPWMFEQLFARGYERVVYLDPDIVVYSPLAELDALPPETFLTLTPHLTGFIGGTAHPSELSILQAGTYNLGFLAISRGPRLAAFLRWWQEKLELECVVDIPRGLFVDQKWMDLTPGLFANVAILRHDGYNVAYWNLRQRTVISGSTGTTVNGEPLRFFHFSGFDPAAPALVSKHEHEQRVRDAGDAGKLFEDYGRALRDAGHATFRNAPYAFGFFADGTPVPNAARVAYRHSADLQAACGDDPFAHPELFRERYDRPQAPPPQLTSVARRVYNTLSSARPLVRLLPGPVRTSFRELLLGPDPAASTVAAQEAVRPGLNIVGYVSRETGVGESARLCRRACEAAQLPSDTIDVDSAGALTRQPLHRATIYHVNADQTPIVRQQLRHVFEGSSYNIGVWHWELPELPDEWIASAGPLDEIWAPSAFVQSAVSRKLAIPVVHMPHGVAVTDVEPCTPQELGVPDGRFTYLCMFDLDSVMQRKNPQAAVDAFRRAFPRQSPAALLVKVSHAAGRPDDYAGLREQLRGLPNVYLTDRMLSRARVNGLLTACDGIVSLHRSEGFGLILAEAMFLGKPVVATGWSGNMDFMNSGNSCPVAYELVTLERTWSTYPAGQQWAGPDLDHAAHFLRRIVDDDAYRTQLGDRARTTIRTQFSPEAAGMRYRRRLELLGLL